MAEVRCPMCGKLNPPDRDECQFCQARLKPLVVSPNTSPVDPIKPGEIPEQKRSSGSEAGLPDWLQDLRQKDEPSSDKAGEPEPMPDWLSEEPGSTSPAEEPEAEGFDWLTRISQEHEPEESLPSSNEIEPPVEPPEPSGTGEPEETELFRASDFSSPKPEVPSETGAPQEAIPDWLAALSSEGFIGFKEEGEQDASPTAPLEPVEGEIPDWLQRVRSRQQSEEIPPTQVFLPDEVEETSSDSEQETPQAGEQLPDWLANLKPQESLPEENAFDIPDWLSADQAPAASEIPFEPGVVPDWLPEPDLQEPANQGFEENQTGEVEENQPVFGADETSTPDWLKKLESSASVPDAGGAVPAFIFDEETGFTEEKIESTTEGKEEAGKTGEEQDTSFATLPEWISQVAASEAEETPAQEASETEDLAPAQLPGWLEAMRPIESVAPVAPFTEDISTQVEKVGPLAGLRGVLPAEPIIGQLRKPGTYSVKLQVTENQQNHADLLQKLLSSEGDAKEIPPRPTNASQTVLRLVIAVALIIWILVPLWTRSQKLSLPDPTSIPAGVTETNFLIGTLKAGDPVLVAIDYEPGLSGEMEAIGGEIVRQIILKGAYLGLVSTNPSGPVLAERLMLKIGPQYRSGFTDYANLGLITGGPSGLLSFANSPRSTFPFDLGNSYQPGRADLWVNGPLSQVESAADFRMLVVITESPDTARYWIEQVQPVLRAKQTPLLLVVSAQAEPMVRPYFEGVPQQVNGLVAGLSGGAAFERLVNHDGVVRNYWDAFSAGLLGAGALILFGSLINIIIVLLAPRKQTEVEGSI